MLTGVFEHRVFSMFLNTHFIYLIVVVEKYQRNNRNKFLCHCGIKGLHRLA